MGGLNAAGANGLEKRQLSDRRDALHAEDPNLNPGVLSANGNLSLRPWNGEPPSGQTGSSDLD